MAVRLTGDLPTAVVGSPAYFARYAPPQAPHELAGHACINYRFPRTGALYQWRFVGPEGDFDVAVEGCLTVNDTRLVLAGALQGTGLAYLLWAMVEQ